MYKLLLSWRYLRTRYIALASIISVTLGVATLIVVNSVMAGFGEEMEKRLHDILSDISVESPGMDGIYDPQWHMDEIQKVVGDDLVAMTTIVRVPAMLHFQYRGRTINQQIMLIGIDESTYADVSDFREYLLHPKNRERLSFLLREDAYDERIPQAGWTYRRSKVMYERAYEEEVRRIQEIESRTTSNEPTFDAPNNSSSTEEVHFAPLPEEPPIIGQVDSDTLSNLDSSEGIATASPIGSVDPFLAAKGMGDEEEFQVFDAMTEQHSGLIIGVSVISTKYRNAETNAVEDLFLCLPGDDVQITLPSAGTPPKPMSSSFTVVDFYESKMSEYDSSFAFMPLRKLQKLRGMIDPQSGVATVTSIQLKLKPGADLNGTRDKLQKRFPPQEYPYRIQTWRDMQGPLLAAVNLETTILNILLFMIIAVAGFGILATFFMIVVEKTRDIGILKALGAPRRGVMSIFLSYGLSLGAVGSGAGIVIGLLFVVYINDIADVIEKITGREVFDQEVYYFQQIPTIIDPFTVTWVAIGAVMIAVMASVLPALRAAGLHPVEALRYE